MPIFEIETIATYVGHERRAGRTYEARILEVEGAAAQGGRNRARFVFSPAVDPRRTAPVGYVTECGETGVDVVGWLPETAYAVYRDVLAGGGRLQVHFETRDRESGYLRRLAIGRANAALVSAAPGELVLERDRTPRRQDIAFAMPL